MTTEQVAAEVDGLAKEHAKHVAGYNTTYKNGVVEWEDRGGIRCSCGWSAEKEPGSTRPWHLWHRHVIASVLAARLDDGLRAGVEALADEWDDAHNLGIQTSYATCADDLRALLDQPHTGTNP